MLKLVKARFSREQVVTIRDYRYVPYIAQDARFTAATARAVVPLS